MIKESRAIGPDWDFSPITFSVRQLLCIKKITLFKFMERLHNRDIKIHKCEMTPEIFARLHASRLIGFLTSITSEEKNVKALKEKIVC